jgi:hypothetical protein
MNRRSLISLGLTLLSLVLVCCAFVQRRQLADLRAEQVRLDSQLESAFQASATPSREAITTTELTPGSVSPELLRLRDQVNRLSRRRDELVPLDLENKRLQAKIEASATNRAASSYIHKSRAQLVGYDSPENTLQSFLWTIQNKDFTRFLEALTPETILAFKESEEKQGYSAEAFFKGLNELVGLGVVSTQKVAEGVIAAQVQLVPELPPEEMIFKQIDGKWKLSMERGSMFH